MGETVEEKQPIKVKVVRVGYYNVMYDISLCSEFDEMKFKYFTDRIQKGEKMFMRDIEQWCEAQNLHYHTSFVYRKDLPLKANIFNYYSYLRGRIEKRKRQAIMKRK